MSQSEQPTAAENKRVEAKPAERTSPPPSFWRKFEGKRVALQFRQGLAYFGVTYPGNFVVDPETKQFGVSPVHEGILHVEEDHTGMRLVLETIDPNPSLANVRVAIVMHPDVVDFATFCEQRLVDAR